MTGLEWIIALGICWWVLRGVGADLRVVARGRTPERVAAGRARAAAGGGRYGLRGYMGDLWSDAWMVARAKRQARVEQRLADIEEHGPGPTWRQRAGEQWSAAWGRWETRMAARWQERRARDGQQPAPEPVAPVDRDTQERDGQEPRVDHQPDDRERVDQEDEQREPADPVTVTPYDPDRHQPTVQELTARPGPGGRWEVVNSPDQQAGEPTRGDHDMSEVTGLASAISHASQMRQAHEGAASGTEAYAASLTSGGVDGDAVAECSRAMELEAELAACWGRIEGALQAQLTVREAYEATPGAGEKHFVTAE